MYITFAYCTLKKTFDFDQIDAKLMKPLHSSIQKEIKEIVDLLTEESQIEVAHLDHQSEGYVWWFRKSNKQIL